MRILPLLLVCACSKNAESPPKVAEAPIHDTSPIPTSSAELPIEAPAASPDGHLPIPSPKTQPTGQGTAQTAQQASQKKTGAVTAEECDKVNTHLAEVIAEGQGATLLQGFQSTEVWKGMREQCMKEVTREKYDCAMAAKTMQKWQECMK